MGTLFTGYLQHNSIQVQKDQLEFAKSQHQENIDFQKRQAFELLINNETEKITKLNKKIHKLQINTDTSYFWNKVYHEDMIEELKNEHVLSKNLIDSKKKTIKFRRSYRRYKFGSYIYNKVFIF